jgi:replicative DNA helicase Mcm
MLPLSEIRVVRSNGPSGKLVPVLYTNSIKYEGRQDWIITERDKESFRRFANFPDFVSRIISLCAPNVVGHNDKKLGILLSAVNTLERKGQRRLRINCLFVGPPGTAKSMLGREAAKLLPNSRYVSGQNASSGKTLTAIVDKENDNIILRHGPVPLSKNSICIINEMGRMQYEDQAHLMDVLEEGEFTKDAYGLHFQIPSPTTIIATCNPIETFWRDRASITEGDIPITRPLLDRFDLLFVFDDLKTEEEIRSYADALTRIGHRRPHNYNFLTKYLQYARTLDVEFTDEAEIMLNDFWIGLKLKGIVQNRGLESIRRLAIAQTKLRLHKLVDSEMATAAMEYFKVLLLYRGKMSEVSEDPRNIVINEIISQVERSEIPITFHEASLTARSKNQRVKSYFGDKKLATETNKRYRDIRQKFVENKFANIFIVSNRPLTLNRCRRKETGICTNDPNDPNDRANPVINKNNCENLLPDIRSDRSEGSDREYNQLLASDQKNRAKEFPGTQALLNLDPTEDNSEEKVITEILEKARSCGSIVSLLDLAQESCTNNGLDVTGNKAEKSLRNNIELQNIYVRVIRDRHIEVVDEKNLLIKWIG